MVITLSIIVWWILIGLVVGAVARLVIPGRQHIGIIVTILIGIVAARRAGRQLVHHARLRLQPGPQPHPHPLALPPPGLAPLAAGR
jgi:hypothetical protein